jgi:hypothetical protein
MLCEIEMQLHHILRSELIKLIGFELNQNYEINSNSI